MKKHVIGTQRSLHLSIRSMAKKRIIVSVTNDLSNDQRVSKICDTLLEMDYNVTLLGRKLSDSEEIIRPYQTKRFRLLFNKGPLFYACYSVRLYWYLLFHSFDVLWSNDLDTLWPNYAISKLKGKKLVFDSHEYFTEVPELVDRKRVQRFWKRIEQRIVPKLKTVFTVSASIAQLYEKEYGIKVNLLRNLPSTQTIVKKAPQLSIKDEKVVIYQGSMNIGRGIELMIEAIQHCEHTVLYLIGKGDIDGKVSQLIASKNLMYKVKQIGAVPHEALSGYTKQANLGLSLEEDLGLNYRYALPNKLFNYIHAGVPSLVSDLPEMKNLISKYQVGEVAVSREPLELAKQITELLNNETKQNTYKKNCIEAAKILNWENEKHVIIEHL